MAIKCSAETTITNQIDATDLIMWYYATTLTTKPLSPSTTSASATPTGWSLIEPTIASASDLSKYIYECLQIVWGDGTCSWGDVQLSASFEAAKQAYNLAHSTASIFTTFEQTHNKTLVDTVNESSSAITTLTESHQYGGINLLSNTKSIDFSSAPYTNSNVSLYSNQAPIDGESFYYCSGPKYFQIDFPTLINNQKYTLSFDISRSSDSRPVFVKIDGIETNIGTAAATTWTRLSHTFIANASTTNAQIRVAFDSTSSTATYIAAIRHIKLEQGSLATPWEYSSNDISTLSNTINTVSQTADSNSSTISNLTQTLGTNANGTTKTNDIVHQVSDISQDLNGITTRVGKTEVALKGNYAVSSTAKGTANKQATISPTLANYELVQGAAITVKFTTENTAANPTLNINSTGAKPIKTYSGATLSESEYKWDAGSTMNFVYDGTNWCIQDSTELTRIKNNETLINQTANNVLIKATESDTTAAQGGQHLIQSLINVAPNGIKISADKVDIEGAAIFSENGYLSQDNINAINNESQTIYIQAVSGTSSISGTTTWVTNTGESVTQDAANLTPVWTIKRPIYRTNYPVLFVATQYKTIDGTVTCTIPLKDDTITVIDAGHITTGTIDASNITVTNLNADNITTGTINGQRIGAGSLSLDKLAEDVYTETEVNNIVDNLQTQIDGAIETWTGTNIPTLNNTPASTWTTDSIKDTHVGDVYFVVNDQSQQNGYNYRFTKTTSNGTSIYSWQLIKDNDVTNALQRLTTAEGKIGNIETFDSTVSSYMTNTDNEITSIKSAATTLAGRVDTAEGTLATKVDTTTFNTLSQTVEGNSSSIQQLTTETTTLTEKVTLGAPYTQVEWVESDGHQFVQLDWIPNKNGEYGFEIDFENYNTRNATNPDWTNTAEVNRTKAGFILGARDSSNASSGNQFVLGCYSPGYLYFGTSVNYDPHMYYDGRRQQCSYHNGIYTAPDGNTYEMPCGSVYPKWGMVIFALSNNATKSSYYFPSSTKLYSCKFYEGNKLAVDLVGAIRNSDGMTGLYDKVEDRFWACSGLGTGEVVGDLGTPRSLIEQTYSFNPTIMDTKDAASRLWSGDAPMLNKLEDGQQITYRIRQGTTSSAESNELNGLSDAGSSSNVYLRLKLANGEYTDWVPCYYVGTSRLTTHYGGGNDVHFTYHENQVIGNAGYPNGWWADANYNTNDNTVTDRITDAAIAGKNGLKPYSLVMKDDEGRWTTLTDISTYNKTNKVPYAGPLQYDNIGYHSTNGSYAAGKEGGTVYNTFTIDFRYSFNITTSAALGLKADKPVFYVGEVHNDGYFYLDTPWYTQTIPTEEDGKTYIYIGTPKDTYRGWLANENTVYRFMDGEFVPVYTHTIQKNTTRISEVEHTVDGISVRIGELETTVETKADGSDVTTISNRLNTISDTVDGHTQSITSLNNTVATKADGSEVTTLSNNLSTLQQDVNTYKTTVASTYATKTALSDAQTSLQTAIDDKAASSDLTALSSRVSTAESTIEQHSDSIALKANSSDVYTKQQSDGLISTEVTNRNAAISAATDAINLSVSENYATKTELSDGVDDAKGYTDSEITSAKAAIKVTTDGISTEVSKINSVKYVTANAASWTLAALRSYATEGHQENWNVNSTEGLRIGDTVYVKSRDGTRNCPIYIKTTVKTINSTTNFTGISHGYEDALPVDTSISSINQSAESIKIQASRVEIDGTAIFTAISSDVDDAITDKGYATTTQAQGYANTAKSEAISAAATDATSKANAAESRIISRGEQLVINGNGFMGNNTNFTNFIFDGSMSNNSPGSFTRAVGFATVVADEMFPVDASKEYIAEFDVMAGSLGAKMYAMLLFYDVDKLGINVQMVSYFPGSTTTLARELKNGDTVVYLTDASGWTDTSTAHQRSLIIWDYTNSFGYTYPAETYSRNYYAHSSGMWNQGSLNKSSNTITLRTAWTGGTHAAGTPISQNSSGGTYSYFWHIMNQTIFPTEWTHISGTYKGMASRNPTPNSGTFWPGTAYCRIGWLWNSGHTSSAPQSQIWITNVSVKEYVASSSDAVKRTQRIYWRTSAPKSSWTMPPAWLQTAVSATDVFDQWTRKVPRLTANADGTGTKYLYLYTCEQREMVNGTLAYTTVLLDDSTTIIDGGSIITNSITANQIAAGSITANEIDASDLHVSAANVDGTLTASQINANGLTIGYSQVTGTPTIPSKVSDLTNDSGFQTASQVNTTITSKGYQTSSQVESAITSKGYATTTQAQGYADAKDSAIAAAAKRTYVSIAVTAINYAAGTATLQATLFVDGTATTSSVTYIWLKDGTAISGQTARTLSVTAAMGLEHVYSCTVTYA